MNARAGWTDEQLAELAHEAIRVLQALHGDETPSVPWASASDHIRAVCLDGVRRARDGETPEQHHDGWCDVLREHGWTRGPVKNEELKTHPCLVPFGELPAYQQAKDLVFLAIVRSLTAAKESA